MQCNRCGRENPAQATFCMYCSNVLISQEASNKQRQRENRLISLIAVLVMFVFLLIGGVILLRSMMKPSWEQEDNYPVTAYVPTEQAKAPSAEEETQNPVAEEEKPQKVEDVLQERTPTEDTEDIIDTIQQNALETKKNDYLTVAENIVAYEDEYLPAAATQWEINNELSIIYEKWDDLLNDVYWFLEEILPTEEFLALQAEESAWIVEKEAAMDEEGAIFAGGSAEPMARLSVAISYTKERCYYLISLIK